MVNVIAKDSEGKLYVHRGTTAPRNTICGAPEVPGGKAKSWYIAEGIITVKDGVAKYHKDKHDHWKKQRTKSEQDKKNKKLEEEKIIQELKDNGSEDVKKLIKVLGI